MWTPNCFIANNGNINIETLFHEISRPLAPIQCCLPHLNLKSMFTCFANIELGVEGGEFFSGGNSVEIHIVLFDARGVHDNFCQDCS